MHVSNINFPPAEFLNSSYILLFFIVGFGSFMFFVAFAVFLSAAIYISPMFCGTTSEKKMMSKPQEVDAGEG